MALQISSYITCPSHRLSNALNIFGGFPLRTEGKQNRSTNEKRATILGIVTALAPPGPSPPHISNRQGVQSVHYCAQLRNALTVR